MRVSSASGSFVVGRRRARQLADGERVSRALQDSFARASSMGGQLRLLVMNFGEAVASIGEFPWPGTSNEAARPVFFAPSEMRRMDVLAALEMAFHDDVLVGLRLAHVDCDFNEQGSCSLMDLDVNFQERL